MRCCSLRHVLSAMPHSISAAIRFALIFWLVCRVTFATCALIIFNATFDAEATLRTGCRFCRLCGDAATAGCNKHICADHHLLCLVLSGRPLLHRPLQVWQLHGYDCICGHGLQPVLAPPWLAWHRPVLCSEAVRVCHRHWHCPDHPILIPLVRCSPAWQKTVKSLS